MVCLKVRLMAFVKHLSTIFFHALLQSETVIKTLKHLADAQKEKKHKITKAYKTQVF